MKKKHSWFGKNVQESQAIKSAQKNMEQQSQEHMIARCEYDLKCVNMGILEMVVLEIGEGGIMPQVKIRELTPQQQEVMRSRIEGKLEDLLVMTGRKKARESSGLVGADGQPIAAPEEKESQPEATVISETPTNESEAGESGNT